MTFTAIRPLAGLANGRDTSLFRVLHASSSISGAQEVGVADEEAFLVVVGVEHPQRDTLLALRHHLAGLRLEHVHAFDGHAQHAIGQFLDADVGLAEDDEEVAVAGGLQILRHVQVGVHARLQHGHAAQAVELGRVGVIGEGAGDQDVEAGIAGLPRRGHQVGAGDGAEFGADQDAGAALLVALHEAALGTDKVAGPALEAGEGDAVFLVRLLHAGAAEVLQDHPGRILRQPVLRLGHAFAGLVRVDQLIIPIHCEGAVRGEAFHREGAGDAGAGLVLIRLVEQVFDIGLGSDGGVDLLLPGDARLPPGGMGGAGFLGPASVGLARDLPFLPGFSEGGVERGAERFQHILRLLPDHVDFGIVGDGFERDMRHAFMDEALAQLARGRCGPGRGAGDLALLALALGAVGEEVVGVARAHQARSRQSEGDAGGVDGDPAAAPLLGDGGGGAGAAGGVEDEIAGVGGHQ